MSKCADCNELVGEEWSANNGLCSACARDELSSTDTNQASEDIEIGQEVWRVISKYPTIRIWIDGGYLSLDSEAGQVLVKKVVVGAIQRVLYNYLNC